MSNDLIAPAAPIEVPAEALSPDALQGVIDDFILREGTDYGSQESAYEQKVARVRKQIEKGDVVIAFDTDSESVTLMLRREFEKQVEALAST